MKKFDIFKRKNSDYKNSFGHVLVVGGSYNMPGAGVLCANAAIRSGAGLVTFAFPESAYPAVACNIRPEIMLLPLKEKNKKLSSAAENQIINFIRDKKVSAVAVGCGCGKTERLYSVITNIIKNFEIYVVIDADGLNVFENKNTASFVSEFISAKAKIIVTPHPKEFERISRIKYKNDNVFRKTYAGKFALNNGIICVLKGNKTVVSDGKKTYVNNTGNPGMATAGSGDVLAGITAAFVCIQNGDLLKKVSAAVYVHGLAGDISAELKTQVSMTAGDIIENIPQALRSLK